MSHSPALAVVRRPRDLAATPTLAKPSPKPALPDEDEDEAASRRRPPVSVPGIFLDDEASRIGLDDGPTAREPNVYVPCKMPYSMQQAVKAIAQERGVPVSEVVRHLIKIGLRSPFAQPRAARDTPARRPGK